jgi:GDP-D-mannose dehydratase
MTTMKARITGITGQDGSCLAELLLDQGNVVHALIRMTVDRYQTVSSAKS